MLREIRGREKREEGERGEESGGKERERGEREGRERGEMEGEEEGEEEECIGMILVLSPQSIAHLNTKFCVPRTVRARVNKMTVKRRNHGRNKHGRGHVNRVRLVSTSFRLPILSL